MRLFNKPLLAVAVTVASSQAMAAGFQLNAQSATGLGRAFAGDAVIADNASVMARNPAAMALFDKMELSLGFETITTMIDVKDAKYCGISCQMAITQPVDSNYDDAGDTSIAPNIHLIVPVNEQFAWGVNGYSNFGTKTEFSDSFIAKEYGGLTDVKSANFGVAGSYRLNEQWSFGAGLDLIYGQGSMKRTASADVPLIGGMDLVNVEKADGWALGFNLGTVYELDDHNRFGLSYRFSPEMDAKDDKGQKIVLPLPDMAEFSGFHKLENTQFAVHYSIQYISWSDFDQIAFSNLKDSPLGPKYNKQYKWQDGWHYSLGGTYYLNNDWTLRAGYMYDTSAQDSLTSVSVPDSDRQWFSAGFTYHIDSESNFDLGLTYLMGKDVKVSESTPSPISGNLSSLSATTRADAILFGLQYSRSF